MHWHADGSGQTNLSNNPSEDSFPIWSRDGKQIGFTSERDNENPEIYVMDTDGSNPTRLTNTTPSNSSWSSWR